MKKRLYFKAQLRNLPREELQLVAENGVNMGLPLALVSCVREYLAETQHLESTKNPAGSTGQGLGRPPSKSDTEHLFSTGLHPHAGLNNLHTGLIVLPEHAIGPYRPATFFAEPEEEFPEWDDAPWPRPPNESYADPVDSTGSGLTVSSEAGTPPGPEGRKETMATHHLDCRIQAGAKNPPARVAKYNGKCASECGRPIRIGDMISCTRDNSNTSTSRPANASTSNGSEVLVMDPSEHDSSEVTEENAPASVAAPSRRPAGLAGIIAQEVLPYIEGKIKSKALIDRKEIEAIVRETVSPVTRVEVVRADATVHDAGVQHKLFPKLLSYVASGCNVWLTGPAGSGKTYAVHAVAKALGLEYGYTGSVQDQYALTGYNDAQGRYVRSVFRERYENGGLFLWDEVDASDANALLAFNAMLANGTAAFPDAMVPRHDTCRLVATANTVGHGGNAQYVGRVKQDGAFLDRFIQLDWTIDEDLERATAGNDAWVRRVQEVRRRMAEKGIRVVAATPRASYYGAKLLANGVEWSDVEQATLALKLTADQWASVR